MGLPSGNIATISSGTSTLRGNKSFSIVMRASYSSTESYSMKVSSIGEYEFDIDVKEDTDDVTEFFINIPTFEFSFWSDIGIDFGLILKQLVYNDLVEIAVTYDGDTDYFLCQKSDFEYDRLKREVTCKCYSPLKYGSLLSGSQISTFDTSAVEISATYSDDPNPQDPVANLTEYTRIVTFNDLLESYLNTFNSSTVVKQTSYTVTKSEVEALTLSDSLVYTREDLGTTLEGVGSLSNNFYIDGFEKARKRILEASIAEAAIVGNGFGTAFYVKRSDKSNTVNINASDLEEFNIEFFTSPVKTITVGVGDTSASQTISEDNPQTIQVDIPSFASKVTFTVLGSPETLYAAGSSNPAYSPLQAENNQLLDDYIKSLGASDTIRFSGTIFGASKLKPYETITLNTAISDYLNSSNNIIRPSTLKYNLKEDKIEFTGYSL